MFFQIAVVIVVVVQVLIQFWKSKIEGCKHTRVSGSFSLVKGAEMRYVSSVCAAHKTVIKPLKEVGIFHFNTNQQRITPNLENKEAC